ncbi:IS66 family insertion sequence element accessory protein TnpA [Adhaeretor mobilis]|uniref:Transposase n=1 Tax=Adhaeretor mobilis TaxID=1930276 RepID=A0A517MVE5_9BACT|nr:hypothetical protein [Adhaeretor mobilis]QDS98854.1 hypothetical protein HG15A2_21400 [Adhaeretor mobilis]
MANKQRDPVKEAAWRKALHQFAASGLSVREFCRREQLAESAFYAWRRTISDRDKNVDTQPAFVPAVINGAADRDEPLVLMLGSGLELQLPQSLPTERVAQLVQALQSRGGS